MDPEPKISQLVDKNAYMRQYMRERSKKATNAINEFKKLQKEYDRLKFELDRLKIDFDHSQNKLRVITSFCNILKNQQSDIIQISRKDLDIFI